jgi:hypothetical protein
MPRPLPKLIGSPKKQYLRAQVAFAPDLPRNTTDRQKEPDGTLNGLRS